MELAVQTFHAAGFHGEIGPVARAPIVLLAGDLDVRGLIPHTLAHREVMIVHTVDQAVELAASSGAETIVCSLLLSHTETREACIETIARLAAAYKLSLFIEPSSHESDYLARHGLKSFHAGIRVNRSMAVLAVDLFLDHAGFAAVEHFGWNVAYDDGATWLVPLDAPPDTFPPGTSWRPRVVFDRLVFEFGCFVCKRYDAPVLELASDLVPISLTYKRSAFQLSGVSAGAVRPLEEVGREIYRSPSSAVSMPDQSVADGSGLALSPIADATIEQAWARGRPGLPFDLRMSLLSDCVVSGRGAIFTNGAIVLETTYMLDLLAGEHAVRNGMARRHKVGHIEGLSVIALNVASLNYYHWLAQIMPALLLARDACERSGIGVVTVITNQSGPFVNEYINLAFGGLGNVEIVALQHSEYVTASRALYANSLGDGLFDRVVSEHALLSSRLKGMVGVSQRPPSRQIYVSRIDTRDRPMTNESALIEKLAERGFEIVSLTGRPITDQIKLFHEARLIVGPHGAGLANVLFARPGATLLELSQTAYVVPCFLRLAQAVGVEHVMQFFDGRDTASGGHQAWFVDVDAVGRAVDRIIVSAPADDFTIAQSF